MSETRQPLKNFTCPPRSPPVPPYLDNVRRPAKKRGDTLGDDVVDGIRRVQGVEPEELVDGVSAALDIGVRLVGAAIRRC